MSANYFQHSSTPRGSSTQGFMPCMRGSPRTLGCRGRFHQADHIPSTSLHAVFSTDCFAAGYNPCKGAPESWQYRRSTAKGEGNAIQPPEFAYQNKAGPVCKVDPYFMYHTFIHYRCRICHFRTAYGLRCSQHSGFQHAPTT